MHVFVFNQNNVRLVVILEPTSLPLEIITIKQMIRFVELKEIIPNTSEYEFRSKPILSKSLHSKHPAVNSH